MRSLPCKNGSKKEGQQPNLRKVPALHRRLYHNLLLSRRWKLNRAPHRHLNNLPLPRRLQRRLKNLPMPRRRQKLNRSMSKKRHLRRGSRSGRKLQQLRQSRRHRSQVPPAARCRSLRRGRQLTRRSPCTRLRHVRATSPVAEFASWTLIRRAAK